MARYLGAAPHKGDQPHHYYLTVTALDTDKLSVAANASPAMIGFTISSHTLAGATSSPPLEADRP
ncbi:hypothetical protein GCM10027030_21900 [Luteococcus sediminum]